MSSILFLLDFLDNVLVHDDEGTLGDTGYGRVPFLAAQFLYRLDQLLYPGKVPISDIRHVVLLGTVNVNLLSCETGEQAELTAGVADGYTSSLDAGIR